MPENKDMDHDTLITLVEQVKNLTEAIKKMEVTLNNLREAFVTRAEFENVKIAVMGVANDGGLVKKVDALEQDFAKRKGTWSTLQVVWTIGVALVGILLTIIAQK